ncbi:hypothetical protein C8Q80DRAFT_954059 [Daedaleopsis nitida]|nr:hypothetical protein C8Q80DRAFT_954059 [Daedaleopsis nitida]
MMSLGYFLLQAVSVYLGGLDIPLCVMHPLNLIYWATKTSQVLPWTCGRTESSERARGTIHPSSTRTRQFPLSATLLVNRSAVMSPKSLSSTCALKIFHPCIPSSACTAGDSPRRRPSIRGTGCLILLTWDVGIVSAIALCNDPQRSSSHAATSSTPGTATRTTRAA